MCKLFLQARHCWSKQLLNILGPKVLFRVWFLLPASILSGFLGFAAIAVIGGTGSLVGSDLGNLLPGLKCWSKFIRAVFMVDCYFYNSKLASVGCPFSTSFNARKSRWRVMA